MCRPRIRTQFCTEFDPRNSPRELIDGREEGRELPLAGRGGSGPGSVHRSGEHLGEQVTRRRKAGRTSSPGYFLIYVFRRRTYCVSSLEGSMHFLETIRSRGSLLLLTNHWSTCRPQQRRRTSLPSRVVWRWCRSSSTAPSTRFCTSEVSSTDYRYYFWPTQASRLPLSVERLLFSPHLISSHHFQCLPHRNLSTRNLQARVQVWSDRPDNDR